MAPTSDQSEGAWHSRVPALLSLVLIAAIWIRRGFGPLWLDETVSYFSSMDGPAAASDRAARYLFQSPLYYELLSLVIGSGLTGEIWLRAPSILALAATALLVRAIARRLLGDSAAWLAVLIFVALDGAIFSAASARPYALGLLLSTLSVWALVGLAQDSTRRLSHAGIFVSATAASAHLHPTFGGIVVVHAAIAMCSSRPGFLRDLAWALAALTAAVFPALLRLVSLHGESSRFSTPGYPSVLQLFTSLVPVAVTALVSMCILYVMGVGKGQLDPARPMRNLLQPRRLWVLAWHFLPPLLIFAAAWISGDTIWFSERYFVWQAPATAILLAAVADALVLPRGRQLFCVFFCIMTLLAEPHRPIFTEDWRSASAALGASASRGPFLFYSGLVESGNLDMLRQPEHRAYLSAPLAYYRVGREPVLLPYRLDQEASLRYWSSEVLPRVSGEREIEALGSDVISIGGRSVSSMLIELLKGAGYDRVELQSFRKCWIIRAWREA